uniref:Uncharacterized protein n=1 Tax=Dulem virus 42 TaxID=3145760 RepID=A0AAU8B8P8_9CAUD
MAKIPITLEAGTADNKLACTSNIYDEEQGRFQSVINGDLTGRIAAVEEWDNRDTVSDLEARVTAIEADGWVTNRRIANNAVNSIKIEDGSIVSADLGDSKVITSKIADSNVTSVKLATNSVTNIKIADGAVTTTKILDANVTEAKLAD